MPDLFDLYEADTSSEPGGSGAPKAPRPSGDLFDTFNAGSTFDPEGDGYDYITAEAAGLYPDATGHWPSRDPSSGQILKGRSHPSFNLTEQGEREAGMQIAKGADGRYYSQPAAPAPAPAAEQEGGDLFDLYGKEPQAQPAQPPPASAPPVASEVGYGTAEESEAAFAALAADPTDTSTFGGVAYAFGRGIAEGLTTELPAQIGKALQFATDRGQSTLEDLYKDVYNQQNKHGREAYQRLLTEGKMENQGKRLAEWAEEKQLEWYGEKPKDQGTIEKMIYEGTKMLAPSVVPAGTLNLGLRATLGIGRTIEAARAASLAGDLVKAAALMQEAKVAAQLTSTLTSAGVSTLFGASQAQETVDTAMRQAEVLEKAGKHDEAAAMREKAHGWAPYVTGGIEAAGEYFGTKYFGKLFKLDEAEVIKRTVKQLILDFFKTLGVEIGTEVGQTYGEATVEKYTAIRPAAEPLAEALNVIGPTIVMTLLTGGAAGVANRMATREEAPGGEQQPEAKPKTEIKIKGAVEPVPHEAGLGFAPTKSTTIDLVDESGESVLPPKEQAPVIDEMDKLTEDLDKEETPAPAPTDKRKQALAGVVEAMFDDLTPEEVAEVRDTTKDPLIKELIDERLSTGKKALGEKAPAQAKEPVAAVAQAEKPVEIPEGHGGTEGLTKMAALVRSTYQPGLKDTDIAPVTELTEDRKIIHQLADIWGVKSTFYKATKDTMPDRINGLALPDERRIFINDTAAAPDLFLLGHESFHVLETQYPDLWQRAMRIIEEEAANFEEYRSLLSVDREAAAVAGVDEGAAKKEFGSDVAGQVFTRPSFWKKLNREDPEIFKALADIVRRLILQVKRAFKGGDKASNAVVKNMERVEATIAEVMGTASKRERMAKEERTGERRKRTVSVAKERREQEDRRGADRKTKKMFERIRDMLDDNNQAREIITELIEKVYTDELMQINSRALFFEHLAEDLDKSPADRRTTVIADLDNFSWFNDALGHPVGDEILRATGSLMREVGVDVYRVGGEELGLLAPDEATAIAAVSKLRQKLEEQIVIDHTIGADVTLKDGTTYKKGEKISVEGIGISYGIGNSYEAADEELTRDKDFRTVQGIRAAKGAEAKRVSRVPGATKGAVRKEPGEKPGAAALSVASRKAATGEKTPRLKTKGTFTVKAEKYAEKRGDTGPFHNTWRVYDADGNRLSLIFTSKQAAEAYAKKLSGVQKKVALSVKSKAFKKWFAKSVITEDGEPGGYPLTVFHGTTADVTEFTTGAVGRMMEWENFLGPGAYFTNSIDDVNENYATDTGPDLVSKIANAKDQYADIEQDQESEILEDFFSGKTPSDWGDLEQTVKEIPEQASEELDQEFADLDAVFESDEGHEWLRENFFDVALDAHVRAELVPDNRGALMPVFLKMQKPFDFSETKLEYVLEYDEQGEDIIDEGGSALDMIDELAQILMDHNVQPEEIDRLRGDLLEKAIDDQELTGDDILEAMVKAEISEIYADDGFSYMSAGAVLREAAEALGYDGIIMDAYKYFGPRKVGIGMAGIYPDTRHYMPFAANQIKSAIGNVGTYTEAGNILLSVKPYDNIEDKKNWSQVAEAAEDFKDLEFTSPVKTTDAGVKGLKAMTTVGMATTGSLKAKNLYAKTPAEAASLLAHIRKHPQENLYVVPVDKKGKILEIHRYTKGVSTAASMRATDISGYVAGVKGATRVYIAHNHPSKSASPSKEDLMSMSAVSNALDLADIEVVPLIVAGTKWVPVRQYPPAIAEQIPGVVRKKKIPIRERVFRLQEAGPLAQDSTKAKKTKADLFGEETEGFMLVNAQLAAVGFYELPKGETTAAVAIGVIRAFERTNANAVFFFGNQPLSAGNNRERLLMDLRKALGTDMPIHDVFTKSVSLRDTQSNHPIFSGAFDPAVGYSSLKVGGPVLSVKRKKEVQLAAAVTKGKEGVTRIAFTEGKKKIGTARLLGTTIGDIDVAEKYRKQGYGKKILSELRLRGGRSLYAVNDASRALAKSAGMIDVGGGRFEFPKTMVAPAAPSFKKWFGASKVVDEMGNPRVMYHATTFFEDFGTFERGASDIGIHFGTKEQANDRIKFRSRFMITKQMEGQRLYPVFLKIENPLRVYDAGNWNPVTMPSALQDAGVLTQEEFGDLLGFEREYNDIVSDLEGAGDDLDEALEELQSEFAEEVVRLLESKGYDGIVYKNKGEIEGMAEIMFRMDAARTDAEKSAIYKEKKALEESDKTQDSYIVFHPNQIKSIWNRGTFDTAKGNILLSAKRLQQIAEPTDEQFADQGPNAYMIGQLGDPELMLSVKKRMADQKWDEIDFEETQFSILNNRIVRELKLFEAVFGASEKAIEVPGVAKKPARGIRTYDLLSEIYRVIESGEAAEIMDRSLPAEDLAKKRGLTGEAAKELTRVVDMLRAGALMSDDLSGAKDTLGTNAKAGRSFDLMLATCDPTEQCRFCYAAKTMLRQGTIDKALRNTLHILMDPINWAKKAAAEAAQLSRTDLPFIRLQGSGDFTTAQQLKGYNALAKHADRPIHIFSRHHEMLRKLVGTAKAPFLKMGSLDSTLYDYYGHKFLVADAQKHGIANAWLYTSEKEIPTLENLHKDAALGLVLAISPELHAKLPFHLRRISCPCDAAERYFISSCRQCALCQMGCMTAFNDKGIDNKGKLWTITDPKRPKAIAPVLAFMKGAHPMTVADFILQKAKYTSAKKAMTKADKLALIDRTAKELGIDPLIVEYSPEVQSYLDISLHLIDDSIKKTLKQIAAFKEGKGYIVLYDRRFAGDEIRTTNADIAKDHIDWLRWLREQAVQGKAYLVGGEAQKPVALKNGELLAQPDLIDKETAKNLLFSVKTAKGFDPELVREANATGAGKAKIGKIVLRLAKKGDRILDFGAGKKPRLDALRAAGMSVDAYEFGENFEAGAHEPGALSKRYDITYASDVANVQATPSMFKQTIAQMAQTVSRKGGRLVVNMPAAPRKGFLGRMTHAQARELLRRELHETFTDVDVYRDENSKANREVLVATGKRSLPLSIKLAADRAKGEESFRKWFAGSDLKHADGTPMVLYHGTAAAVDFDTFTVPNAMKLIDQLAGFHFARSPKTTEYFTKDHEMGRVIPAFVAGKVHVLDQKMAPEDVRDDEHAGIIPDVEATTKFIFQTAFENDKPLFVKWWKRNFQKVNTYKKAPEGKIGMVLDEEFTMSDAKAAEFAEKIWDLLKARRMVNWLEFKDYEQYQKFGFITNARNFGDYVYQVNAQAMALGPVGRLEVLDRFRQIMKEKGISVLQYTNTIETISGDNTSYIVLDPTKIKSIWNRGSYETTNGNIMLSTKHTEWHRQIEDVLEKKLPGKGSAQSLLDTIRAFVKKGEIKGEELEWSGLLEWLETNPKRVATKDEVLEFLRQNRYQVDEVVKGGVSFRGPANQTRRAKIADDIYESLLTTTRYLPLNEEMREAFFDELADVSADYVVGDNPEPLDDFIIDFNREHEELQPQVVVDIHEAYYRESGEDATKYPDYVVEGGKKYRELIMTGANTRRCEVRHAVYSPATGFLGYIEAMNPELADNPEAMAISISTWEKAGHSVRKEVVLLGDVYTSSHWEGIENPLVHIRFNERIDADGRKVLFIEELQSDWHQEGRKYGYRSGEAVLLKLLDKYPKLPKDPGTWSIAKLEKAGVTNEEIDEWYDARMRGTTPNAPFKQTWAELGIKRMVKWAVEHGFERIAWTPGQVQAERYDLRKQVSAIMWEAGATLYGRQKLFESDRIPTVDLYYIGKDDGLENLAKGGVPLADLHKYVGKDAAAKILEQHKTASSGQLEGEDLAVGGEGMLKFYDQMLVVKVNKMFNKASFGKAKVSTTTIDTGEIENDIDIATRDEAFLRFDAGDITREERNRLIEEASHETTQKLEVWALDVTDQMREKAKDLPLFSVKPADVQPAKGSVYLRNYLEAVTTPEAARALSLREAGIPFWHEFVDRHAANGRATIKDIKRLYTDLYGTPEPVKIGRHQVLIGNRKSVPMLMVKAPSDFVNPQPQFSVKNDPEIRPIAMEYLKMLEATAAPKPAKSAGAAAAKISENILNQLRKEVRDRMQAAEGIPVPRFIDKGKKGVLGSWHSFTRSFADLDSRNFGDVTNVLRLHREAPDNAVRRAMDVMVNLLDGLDHNQYTAFRMKLIMDDMVKDIDSGLLKLDPEKDETFPFGFADVAEVKAFHAVATDAVAGDAKVQDAIRRRTRFNRKLKELLVKHDLLREEVLDDDRYFHHQVLEYRAVRSLGDEYITSAGLGQKSLQYKKKGWQLARKGSLKEYNTDYAQAEYEVLAQAFLQLETKATLHRLHKIADFTPKAKEMAKLHEAATGEKKDWKEFIPDTHIPWKPMPNSAWYKASTVTDRILDKVLAGDMVLGPEHVREMFVKGRDKEWYIPRELAKTLNEFGNEFNDKFWMANLSAFFQTRWKAWTLISPFRIIKYNVNNMSGDADIAFAYNPLIFKYFPKALKDLSTDKWGDIKDEATRKELEMAKRLGVIGSGWSVQELTQVTKKLGDVKALKALFETPSLLQKMVGAPKGLAKGYWEGAKNITEVRENILRLAAFRHFIKEIEAGKKVYAASKKSEVDAVTDTYEKAAKLSRELVGDYGNISHGGRWLRRHLIPFWSWMEVNAPRYVRLLANIRHEGQRSGAGTVARTVASTTVALSFKTAILGAKMAALAVMINLWNSTFFPDEEEELTDQQRRQLHLVLGRRKDGTIISLRIQGALSDAMSFFGGEDISSDVKDVAAGRKTVGTLAKEAVLATPKKLLGGLRPEGKAVYELLEQKSLYPDPENPRAIRDRWEYVARLFSLNIPYQWAAGRPKRGKDLGAQLISDLMGLGLYSSDPGESAYYNAMAWAHEYLEKVGEESFVVQPTAKGNYLYYYKKALKYGDLKAAQKYLNLYAEEGGTPKQMAASVKRAHPLNMIPRKYRAGFESSLSPSQAATLERATAWYFSTYHGPEKSMLSFPPRGPKDQAMTLRKFKLGG